MPQLSFIKGITLRTVAAALVAAIKDSNTPQIEHLNKIARSRFH